MDLHMKGNNFDPVGRYPQHYLFISSETTAETQGCNKHSWGTHPPKWSTTGRAARQQYKEATSGKQEDSQRESKSLKNTPKIEDGQRAAQGMSFSLLPNTLCFQSSNVVLFSHYMKEKRRAGFHIFTYFSQCLPTLLQTC